ncbi:putative reverse transcriptase, partial [Trifolium medium]|nr:putative reverse transcriptase [Trifolium medium]
MYVSNLMVDGERKWDATKINEFFSSDMAEAIMSVPLFPMIEHDKLMWDGDKNGVYTVRSGNKLIMSDLLRSESNYVEGKWSELWRVQAPPKARHLAWRVCRDCIPTRERLLQRHVDCSPYCPLCDENVEDTAHAFFTCPM